MYFHTSCIWKPEDTSINCMFYSALATIVTISVRTLLKAITYFMYVIEKSENILSRVVKRSKPNSYYKYHFP
jgi:SHS2 domain-containing protein